ncbi:hypothetical protein Patl1_05490 [Pistacia atlantica]|uniref:Uncharacterized protein n=1 Tax=Pistacia atlantica TaxID=434234 RepID=A0ACC1BWE8_9ROSI|nr:hypothetical protein Patl1_05490 [Pistacia atlantica]
MEGLVSSRTASLNLKPKPDHFSYSIVRSVPMDPHRRHTLAASIRAQQPESKDGSAVISPVKEDAEIALKAKEWEVGMFRNEVAASQGIRIRRAPTGPPVENAGPFELRIQNESSSQKILE